MPITSDPDDPRLKKGIDTEPSPQSEAYLVLSEEERAKGFVRPVRLSYKHIGAPAPKYLLFDLTDEQKARVGTTEYVKFEQYPDGQKATGRYWTQAELDNIEKGCGTITTMHQAIAETWARTPHFYGATYCVHCGKHLPVSEFVWLDDGMVLGL